MPVSKKRKKDGKPVHRKAVAPTPEEAHPHGADAPPAPVGSRAAMGRPSNPFIAMQRKSSQRGR